ncbi:MAG TPA: kelch repeat-containing protein [Polyangium sp.]|nr:kelch repeat-containing protein [Polyangium sp.]
MRSLRMKTLLIPIFGTILGCSPRAFDVDEVPGSQSFAVQVEDVVGNTSFQRTRPSFGSYAERAAVRLQDGRVLVVGGNDSLLNQYTNRAEVFDPVTEKWAEMPPMTYEHGGVKMFLLKDGRVVTLGGSLGAIEIPEVFDPKSETWTAAMPIAPPSSIWADQPPAALLDNGNVLIASGYMDPIAYFFDTNTLTWSLAPPLKRTRSYHSLTLLQDGRVLAAGGIGYDQVSMADKSRIITEIYDPQTNQWSDAAGLNAPHENPLTSLLDDGRVLLVDLETGDFEIFDPAAGPGGKWTLGVPIEDSSRYFASLASLQDGRRILVGGDAAEGAERDTRVFVPGPGKDYWLPVGKLKTSRIFATATLLEDGRVLIAAGVATDLGPGGRSLREAELFVPNEPSVWKSLGKQPDQRGLHTSTRLDDGRVLVAGFSADSKDSFIFSPDTDALAPTAPMANPHAFAAAVVLDDGRVMVAGGASDSKDPWNTPITSVEFYDPKTAQWSPGPAMNQTHVPAFAIRLADGRVLAGSRSDNSNTVSSVEIFDPVRNTWTPLEQPLQQEISWNNAVVLGNDQVLFSGFKNSGGEGLLQLFESDKNEFSDPIPIPDFYPGGRTDFLMLPDGRALVASSFVGTVNTRMGFFEPLHKTWDLVGLVPLESGPANLLLGGDVFWAAGSSPLPRSIVFSPGDEQFTLVESPADSLVTLAYQTTPLVDGRMLVTGDTFGNKDGAYLYGKSVGGACSRRFECASGHCVDGYCCNEACDDAGSCNTCARAHGAVANGTCFKFPTCAPYQCNHIEVLPDGQEPVCTTACANASDCAKGYACTPEGSCEAPTPVDIDEGCSMVPGKTGSSAGWWFVAACLGLSRVRRRTIRHSTKIAPAMLGR